jgi:disulfide oxidoreductase YuzD
MNRKELEESIGKKAKWMKINKIQTFEPWIITPKQFSKPSERDREKYANLRKMKKWYPVILIDDNLLFDGYHRLALSKYEKKTDKILVVQDKKLTKEEFNFIRS